jgi:hypothetical protein
LKIVAPVVATDPTCPRSVLVSVPSELSEMTLRLMTSVPVPSAFVCLTVATIASGVVPLRLGVMVNIRAGKFTVFDAICRAAG